MGHDDMATGDVQGNLERLRRALRNVRYPVSLDSATHGVKSGGGIGPRARSGGKEEEEENVERSALAGDPAFYLPVLHHVLLVFSRHVAGAILGAGYELHAKTDMRFVEAVHKLLASEFGYRMALTPRQFFSPGFAERKMMLIDDVVQLCRRRHNDMVREIHKAQLNKHRLAGDPSTSVRHSKLREVHNDTIHVRVSPNVEGTKAVQQTVHHIGSDSDGQLKSTHEPPTASRQVPQPMPRVRALREMPVRLNRDNLVSRSVDSLPLPQAQTRALREEQQHQQQQQQQMKKVHLAFETDEDGASFGNVDARRGQESGETDDRHAEDKHVLDEQAMDMEEDEEEEEDDDYSEEMGRHVDVRAQAHAQKEDDEGRSSSSGGGSRTTHLVTEQEEGFLERIRALVMQACGSLDSKLDAMHVHARDMERRLAARITILEGRVKFLEQSKRTTVPAPSAAAPTPSAAATRISSSSSGHNDISAHELPSANFKDQSTTVKHQVISHSARPPALSASLPTTEFIAAVEQKFKTTKLMIQGLH